jgi:glycerate kinase
MTRVLVAPDKFKGSLTAVEVAESVRRGLAAHAPALEVACLPVADGGDGTLAALVAAGFERVPATATGPTGEPVACAYAVHGDVAVIEMADVSGLSQLPEGTPAPLTATSRGTGELVAAALDRGATRIVLGIGGSATTDGGAGMLQALGVSLRDTDGTELAGGGGPLAALAEVDVAGLHPGLAAAEVVVACDVDNPLTGASGATAVYGPQKGATPDDVTALDAALSHFADHVARVTGADRRDEAGAGAAGGVGFAALAMLQATLRPGIDLVLELVGFEHQIRGTDLVVVGEGSLDVQTLHGKAPVGVARRAREAGARVVAVCGRCLLDDGQLRDAGIDAAYACADLQPDPARSMAEAAALLERIGARIAQEHVPTGGEGTAPTGQRFS